MNNIIDRAKTAAEYAYPYIDDARDYASLAVYKAKRGIKKGKEEIKAQNVYGKTEKRS